MPIFENVQVWYVSEGVIRNDGMFSQSIRYTLTTDAGTCIDKESQC